MVRTTIEALAAVLGGTNSLHTNALDETLALPTEESAEIALRTQQVLAEETGVVNVADPLGGSWYVEALTDRMEAEAEAIFARIEAMGGGIGRSHSIGPITSGVLLGIEEGWFTGQIADAAFRYQTELEKGDKKIVGVNVHTATVSGPLEILRVSHEVEREQCAALAQRRTGRDPAAVQAALEGAGRRGPDRGQPDRADAGRRPGRGDPGRDLRRAAGRMGGVRRASPLLSRPNPPGPRVRTVARPTMTAMATGDPTATLRHHVVVVGADSTAVRLVEELARGGEQLVVVAPSRSIGAVTAEIQALGGQLLVADHVREAGAADGRDRTGQGRRDPG